MSKLRVLIADDERPARMFLKNLLDGFEDVEVIGEAENGAKALELIEEIKPDLAFLDLQMPELNGLQVVKLLPENCRSLIVFVTADETSAVEMFEAGSIEYLLKPVGREELRDVINRVKPLVQSRVAG
jgi:YesN/AraC family two-component response regulator